MSIPGQNSSESYVKNNAESPQTAKGPGELALVVLEIGKGRPRPQITQPAYRGRSDLIASGSRSSSKRARSAAIPPRYDGTGVVVSTSRKAITEKQIPATAAETSI